MHRPRPQSVPDVVPLTIKSWVLRVLRALGIGLLATVVASAAGGAWFALMAILLDRAAGVLAAPGIVAWGLVLGPIWALPVTLGWLPLLRVGWPARWRGYRGRVLLAAGPVAGALHMARLVEGDHATGVMSWVLVGAATAGGLAAGLVFRSFETSQSVQGPAASSVPSDL